MVLAFIVDAYEEMEDSEVVLRFNPRLAPIKVAVFPLVKKDKLPDVAKQLYDELKKILWLLTTKLALWVAVIAARMKLAHRGA